MDLDRDAEEILSKKTTFEIDHAKPLSDFSRNYNLYRANPTKQRKENQSNTFYPEMTIEVEALATAVHEMVFSDASDARFFQLTGNGYLDSIVRAHVSESVLEKQMQLNKFEKKTLPFLRKLILQGTYPADMRWHLRQKSYFDPMLSRMVEAFDCWDFEPFDIVNFGFDNTAAEIERQEFSYRLMNVKPSGANKMARRGVWNASVVAEALGSGITRNSYDTAQRQSAGYSSDGLTRGLTAIEYVGTLESRGDDQQYWAVLDLRSKKFLMEPELNPWRHGEKPWLACQWIALPEEFYGLGIGHLNYRTQHEINDRRNFINDLLYSSLYNMWLARSDSGLSFPGNKMRWRPHEVLTADGISDEFLRALRPDMAGLGPAMNLENGDIEKMRRTSGATSSLQAVATGVTATESQTIQSEATRRVKAMVRSQIASFMRDIVIRSHQLNLQFLERPIAARFVHPDDGLEMYGTADQNDLLLNPDFKVKMTTDLDFRPFKRRELIELLQSFGALAQSGILDKRRIIPDPIIEELAQTYHIDPRKFFNREGLMEMETRRMTQDPRLQQRAMSEVVQESPAAQQMLEQMPMQGALG